MTELILKLVILVLTVSLASCGQKRVERKDRVLNSTPLQVDTSVIAVLPFDTAQYWVFKDCKPAKLTNGDFLKIENLIRDCIDNYNPVQERNYNEITAKNPNLKIARNDFIINLTKYKRQYIAVTNSKGEKEVWINCFCDSWGKKWREELIFVLDGGNCYFNLKINLSHGEYYELMVNGDA
jgi:hypothetical protein